MHNDPTKMQPINLPCKCGHNLLNHQHIESWGGPNSWCGFPGCECDAFIGAATPDDVLQAIKVLADYCQHVCYGSVTVSRQGGAAFALMDDPLWLAKQRDRKGK